MKETLLNQLSEVQKIAEYSKTKRFLNHPGRYIEAIFFRKVIYPFSKKERFKEVNLFFSQMMNIALPASTDIYLTGGKSHDSEIRLAKFLIKNLNQGDNFVDIGAHYGYFTLLGAHLVGKGGRVFSFEPGKSTYSLLEKNTTEIPNINVFNLAVSDKCGLISFYEFQSMYSEYNSKDVAQFEREDWFISVKPKRVDVDAITIDQIVTDNKIIPTIIKMDVEGGEYDVIKGAMNYLAMNNTYIVMEYLASERENSNHKKATELLRSIGYKSYLINAEGKLTLTEKIDPHFQLNNIDSDNIVFRKT